MPTLLMSDPPAFGPGRPSRPGPSSTSTFYSFTASSAWAPSINLYETEHAYVVCVELAGVDKDKIDVELVDSVLTLSGHRAVPTDFDPECLRRPGETSPNTRCKIHVMEIDHGAFTRSVEIPSDANHDAISAKYRNGFLWIDIPKNK